LRKNRSVHGLMQRVVPHQSTLVMQIFFFRMQENIEIQKQAQKELDTIIGRGKLPGFADKANLPYIDALSKELLRHIPAAPTGISSISSREICLTQSDASTTGFPHKSTSSDNHDGFFLPKGAVLVASIS